MVENLRLQKEKDFSQNILTSLEIVFFEVMSKYSKARHTVYYHRYHIVWITKYRYKVMNRAIKLQTGEIISIVAEEMRVTIENGIVSSDHIHLFVSIPPHICVSDFVQKAKGKSSRRLQTKFPDLKKRYRASIFGQ